MDASLHPWLSSGGHLSDEEKLWVKERLICKVENLAIRQSARRNENADEMLTRSEEENGSP